MKRGNSAISASALGALLVTFASIAHAQEGIVVDVNPAWSELFGHADPSDLLGQPLKAAEVLRKARQRAPHMVDLVTEHAAVLAAAGELDAHGRLERRCGGQNIDDAGGGVLAEERALRAF